MGSYEDFYRHSLDQPEAFWAEQARLIDWERPFDQVLDASRPPFARWFVGGRTNLCHNAVDRHLATRAWQPALVFVSTETDQRRQYTYAQLHAEVNRVAAMLRELGVGRGDRVIVYMPMVPEALFTLLACTRLGAIHSVVFGGFAAHSLAMRIDDARPVLLVTADAGMRSGRVVPYKPLVDEALTLAQHPPAHVLVLDRGLVPGTALTPGRDVDFATLGQKHEGAQVPVEWLESSEPSYILYTSGTTGKPKGVQRDTGGYAVALAASMRHIYTGQPGEAIFTASDIGWVVGHSYIVYGPLLNGMTTVLYEGLPTRPDASIWWRLVEEHQVSVMFTSPTAIRVLKKQDASFLKRHDTSRLRYLFLAGEPLDAPTHAWISDALPSTQVLDNYWQTETGWPILGPVPGVQSRPRKLGSPGAAIYGYRVKLLDGLSGAEVTAPNQKGVLVIEPPLPPGCLSTVWGDDERFVSTYFSSFETPVYNTFDWALRDEDGDYFILGRTDDVINVAGHRLGTREIEEAISGHPAIAEVAVVGVKDELKGQVVMAFAVPKDPTRLQRDEDRAALEREVMDTVGRTLGAVARPAQVHLVANLPKTRSGKLLRRSIQAVAEAREPGDLTTIEDPTSLEGIQAAMKARGPKG
ncbi:propionate--CoA ligase [Corallococcus praedator]|uniref:Propionate--CoA ligase n=1 Tax=Corallococcus praedator TaxID=2316724 RepID=A0ABX9QQF9_9BACT|nr:MULTISPECIES: propionate--CoA ligase [Corallococcus]RKH33615.1 propionate--CoA ligase [Corallococcus sp. CA031C]RKI14809.1 propionate--CoA ligase [Corallococcus praedator]